MLKILESGVRGDPEQEALAFLGWRQKQTNTPTPSSSSYKAQADYLWKAWWAGGRCGNNHESLFYKTHVLDLEPSKTWPVKGAESVEMLITETKPFTSVKER